MLGLCEHIGVIYCKRDVISMATKIMMLRDIDRCRRALADFRKDVVRYGEFFWLFNKAGRLARLRTARMLSRRFSKSVLQKIEAQHQKVDEKP